MKLLMGKSSVGFWAGVFGLAFFSLTIPALAQYMGANTMGEVQPGLGGEQVAGRSMNTNSVSGHRETFFTETGKTAEMDYQLSQLAATQSSSDPVKGLAKQISAEYPSLINALNSTAQKADVSFSGKLPKSFDKDKKKLQALTGPDFDKAYLKTLEHNFKNQQTVNDRNSYALNTVDLHQFGYAVAASAKSRLLQVQQLEKTGTVASK